MSARHHAHQRERVLGRRRAPGPDDSHAVVEAHLDQLSEFLADYPAPPAILPFASIVDRRKKLQREIADALAAQTCGFLPTVIPNSSALERMGVEQAPIATYAPSSPAAIAFRHLWSDVLTRLWN